MNRMRLRWSSVQHATLSLIACGCCVASAVAQPADAADEARLVVATLQQNAERFRTGYAKYAFHETKGADESHVVDGHVEAWWDGDRHRILWDDERQIVGIVPEGEDDRIRTAHRLDLLALPGKACCYRPFHYTGRGFLVIAHRPEDIKRLPDFRKMDIRPENWWIRPSSPSSRTIAQFFESLTDPAKAAAQERWSLEAGAPGEGLRFTCRSRYGDLGLTPVMTCVTSADMPGFPHRLDSSGWDSDRDFRHRWDYRWRSGSGGTLLEGMTATHWVQGEDPQRVVSYELVSFDAKPSKTLLQDKLDFDKYMEQVPRLAIVDDLISGTRTVHKPDEIPSEESLRRLGERLKKR